MTALLALAAGLTGARADDRDGKGKTFVGLEDGSFFPARSGGDAILLKTSYGDQRVPYAQIRSLRRTRESEFLLNTTGLAMTGEIAAKSFDFETDLGRLRVPVGDLRMMTPGTGMAMLADPSTAALWSMSDVQNGACHDLVKNRRMTVRDMDVQVDADGVAGAVRRSEAAAGEIAPDADLDFSGSDFTMEVRAKIGKSTRNYTSLLWKSDGARCDYSLLVQANGYLYIAANSNQFNFGLNVPSGPVKMGEWSYIAVVCEAKNRAVTVYVNGKQVHQSAGNFQPLSNGVAPLTIGDSAVSPGNFSAPEAIQFVRLSRTARRADEIRDCQAMLESGRNIGGAGVNPGVSLRDGGFIRGKFPALAGATFRTSWGSLKLADGMGGRLSIHRHRPETLEAVQRQAKEEVSRLGAGAVDEREEAQARLFDLAEVAVPFLKEGLKDKDAELRSRAGALLKKLEDAGIANRPVADVLQIGSTRIHGWLEAGTVEIATAYGSLHAPLARLEGLNLGVAAARGKRLFRLKTGEAILADVAGGSSMDLETSFGKLTIPLREVTSLAYDEAKQSWSVKTDRMTATGKASCKDLSLETPAGVLTIPISEVREIAVPSAPPGP
jgi:hypothetical protein